MDKIEFFLDSMRYNLFDGTFVQVIKTKPRKDGKKEKVVKRYGGYPCITPLCELLKNKQLDSIIVTDNYAYLALNGNKYLLIEGEISNPMHRNERDSSVYITGLDFIKDGEDFKIRIGLTNNENIYICIKGMFTIKFIDTAEKYHEVEPLYRFKTNFDTLLKQIADEYDGESEEEECEFNGPIML